MLIQIMKKTGFKRSNVIKSHSIYETQKKNERENVQDNKTKTNIFSVIYLSYANDFLFICKTE